MKNPIHLLFLFVRPPLKHCHSMDSSTVVLKQFVRNELPQLLNHLLYHQFFSFFKSIHNAWLTTAKILVLISCNSFAGLLGLIPSTNPLMVKTFKHRLCFFYFLQLFVYFFYKTENVVNIFSMAPVKYLSSVYMKNSFTNYFILFRTKYFAVTSKIWITLQKVGRGN